MILAKRALLLGLWIACLSPCGKAADELSLFDSKGEPKAYIAEDLTIYSWDGDPMAYLVPSSGKTDIYNFDGTHLGWFENGIIRDHDGNGVAFVKGAVNMVTSIEPIKSIKSIKAIKGIREIAPIKPIFGTQWSAIPLLIFLKTGATAKAGSFPSTLVPPSSTGAGASSDIVESHIQGEFEGWSGDTIFALDNGQLWQQSSYAYMYHYAYRPKVTIIKSGLG